MTKAIDEIIREAMQRGEFDDLKNKGKPLDLEAYFALPEEVRLAYTVLQNAGELPEEVSALREIEALHGKLKGCTDEAERKQVRAEIEKRRLKYNLGMERRRSRRG